MSLLPTPTFRLRIVLLALSTCAALAWPAVAQDVTQDESAAAATADRPAADATAADDDTAEESQAAEEDGYEWLVDDEGREYRVDTLPKVEDTYRRLENDFVRFPGGATFPVIRESDDTFWVKVFKPEQFKGLRSKFRRQTTTPVQRQAIEAEFAVDIESVDRLQLVTFDQGLPKSGQWRNGFDLADMNGDGHVDLVFGPARKSSAIPVIFLHDGAGNWRRWQEAEFEPAPYDYGDVTVGDWNADGHLDLAFGVHLRGVLAVVGDGKGKFSVASDGIDFDVPGSGKKQGAFSSRSVETLDWNGDGRDDILALGEGPKRAGTSSEIVQGSTGMRAFLSQEDGSWQTVPLSPPMDRNFGDGFVVLDQDGDGRDDIVSSTAIVGNSWLVLRDDPEAEGDTLWLTTFEGLRKDALVDGLAVADFDGDGRQDLAHGFRANILGDWRSGIDLLLRRDDGWERRHLISFKQRESFRALAAGDVDGDGHVDLAALDDMGKVRILLGNGDGSMKLETSPETPPARMGCQGYDVALRDLDGDGLPEVVAAFAGETQGMAPFTGSHMPGCEDGGSLRAWKTTRRDEEPVSGADS